MTGIGPQSIPIIKLSNFSNADEIADYTFNQLGPRLKSFKYLAIGIEERNQNAGQINVDELAIQSELIKKISETLSRSVCFGLGPCPEWARTC